MTIENWIDKINNVVRNFIKTFDEEYDCRYNLDFCACLDENIIEWSLLVVERSQEGFCNNFINHFPKAKGFDYFVLALLHEIGHFETEWKMIDDTAIRNTELTQKEYYNLFNERIATDWAGNWINENFEQAKDFNNTILNLLNEFYNEMLD